MKPFEIGDSVVCLVHGEGVVQNIYATKNNLIFPVTVEFSGSSEDYTSDGCLFDNCNPTLFHKGEEPILVFPKHRKGDIVKCGGVSVIVLNHYVDVKYVTNIQTTSPEPTPIMHHTVIKC